YGSCQLALSVSARGPSSSIAQLQYENVLRSAQIAEPGKIASAQNYLSVIWRIVFGPRIRGCRVPSPLWLGVDLLHPGIWVIIATRLDLIRQARCSHLRVISRMVFVPRISRMSSRFTAVARRWSSVPMTFSTIGSILSRKLSNEAQLGYSTRIRMLKSCGPAASPFRIL